MFGEWTDSLQVGDAIIVAPPWQSHPYKVGKVGRLTKAQVVVEVPVDGGHVEERFIRKTGKPVGGSGYHQSCLMQDTPENRQEVEHRRLVIAANKAAYELDHCKDSLFHYATIEQLQRVIALYDELAAQLPSSRTSK